MSKSLVRAGTYAQKKHICIFAAELTAKEDNTSTQGVIDPETSGAYHLGNLPPEALIVGASIFVIEASDAATSAVATLGTDDDTASDVILDAANLKVAGSAGTFQGALQTGSGSELWLDITITGAATDVGEYLVVVEYIEYNKNTGEYTSLQEAAA